MRVIATQSGGFYFLYGYGGTGKTFIWKTLSSAIWSNGGIVLTVASMVLHHYCCPEEEQHTLSLPYQCLQHRIQHAIFIKGVTWLNC